MGILSKLSVLAVSAAAILSSASAQTSSTSSCTSLVGAAYSESTFTYYPSGSFVNGGSIQAVGYFTTDTNLDTSKFKSFVFTYTVPDQTGEDVPNFPAPYETPNHLRFALYTNPDVGQGSQGGPNGDGNPNGATGPTLVADSVQVLIKDVEGVQSFLATIKNQPLSILPGTQYILAVWNEYEYLEFVDPIDGKQYEEVEYTTPYHPTNPFPSPLPVNFIAFNPALLPVQYLGCTASGVGDPEFTGFNGEKFIVKGLVDRVYNVLSLPTLQLNTRFIPLTAGQAMNNTQQQSVRHRQSKLMAALKRGGAGAGAGNRLPSTTSWSHDGLYMGETGVQLAGHKLLIKPGAYESGFEAVELDGQELAVSSEPVQLLDGSSITRSSSSVVDIASKDVLFTLVNSDHFVNIHSAVLAPSSDVEHVDGLLGHTASPNFHVERTKEFKQHVEEDFLLPEGEDVWSTSFDHNQYIAPASAI